ncbi:MAG: protein tyrosine phosphatase [Bacteroidetes bacterium]|nr:MAG: protein tyrosine phosphatase [Bacteroidota bacterium]
MRKKISVVFVCHGNICRSPMAEFVMKDLVFKAGLSEGFEISSAAVSSEEIGNDMYGPAKAKLLEHGVPFTPHSAHRITLQEYVQADVVVVMDESNMRLLGGIVGDASRVRKMMSFAGRGGDVADPWYTRDFEATYRDVLAGCQGLLQQLNEGG